MPSSPIHNYVSEVISKSGQAWERFWFSRSRGDTLGAIRICTGLMLVYTHLVWGCSLQGFFGSDGQLPVAFSKGMHGPPWESNFFAWSHLYGIQSAAALWTVHAIAIAILVLYTVGLFTRVTSILAFLVTVSYAHRGIGALFGLDQINAMLVMYTAVGRSGDCYSVDRWLRRRSRPNLGADQATPAVSSNIALRLIQCHMCVIYLFAGLGKLLGSSWWDGTALWGAFGNFEYQTLDMTWVASYEMFVNVMTQTILVWEVTYVALIWHRLTRPLVLLMAIPLHLGIAVCMGMTTFGLIMLVGNMAFVPDQLIRVLMQRLVPSQHNVPQEVAVSG